MRIAAFYKETMERELLQKVCKNSQDRRSHNSRHKGFEHCTKKNFKKRPALMCIIDRESRSHTKGQASKRLTIDTTQKAGTTGVWIQNPRKSQFQTQILSPAKLSIKCVGKTISFTNLYRIMGHVPSLLEPPNDVGTRK